MQMNNKNKKTKKYFIEVQMIKRACYWEAKARKLSSLKELRFKSFADLHRAVDRVYPITRRKLESIFDKYSKYIKYNKVSKRVTFVNRDKAYYYVDKHPEVFDDFRFMSAGRCLKKDIRIEFMDIAITIYDEIKRRCFVVVEKETLVKSDGITPLFKGVTFTSSRTQADELGISKTQLLLRKHKMKFFWGEDYYRKDTIEEKMIRKYRGTKSYSTNLPPMFELESIFSTILVSISKYRKGFIESSLRRKEWIKVYRGRAIKSQMKKRYFSSTFTFNRDRLEYVGGIFGRIEKLLSSKDHDLADDCLKFFFKEDASIEERLSGVVDWRYDNLNLIA